VQDTYQFRNELSVDRMSDVIGMLKSAARGSRINVTYLKQAQERTETETTDQFGPDMMIMDKVHTCTLMIHNFELILTASMDFNYESETTLSEFTGEALVYPGFMPSIGDMFLYEMPDGRVGLFEINQVPKRLSIRSNTYHSIQFELNNFMNQTEMTQLMGTIVNEAYFDLERFLTEDGAVLKSEEYQLIKEIEQWTKTLAIYYIDTFFDKKDYMSLIRPDRIYDPYIVEFFKFILSREDSPLRPVQLIGDVSYWKRSFWWRILSPGQVNSAILVDNFIITTKLIRYMTTQINALSNRDYLILTTDQSIDVNSYIESVFGTDHDQPVWSLLDTYFDRQLVDTIVLMDLVRNFGSLTAAQQFYHIPLYLALMMKVRGSMKSGNNMLETLSA